MTATARSRGPPRRLRQDRSRQGHLASPSTPARSSPSSAPTAPARPPRCAPSPGCSSPSAARSPSTASRSTSIPAHKIVALGTRPLPRGPAHLPPPDHRGEPPSRRLPPQGQAGIQKDIQRAYDLFPILGERRNQAAGTLSGGEQQMLAMGRALMSRPKLLMLDEPSMGLSPIMMQKIMATIAELQVPGHDDPARRAERPGGALPRRPRPRHGDRQHRPLRHRPGPAARRVRPQGVPRRGLRRTTPTPAHPGLTGRRGGGLRVRWVLPERSLRSMLDRG